MRVAVITVTTPLTISYQLIITTERIGGSHTILF